MYGESPRLGGQGPGPGEWIMGDESPDRSEWTGEALDRGFRAGPAEYLFYLMLQAVRRRETALNKVMQPLGLTAAKWHAGAVLKRLGGCSMADLAHLSAVDRTTLTRIVDQLVDEGLAERGGAPGDRRKVMIRLTDKGAAVIDRARAVSRGLNEGVLDGADEAEQIAALRLLQRVLGAMIPDDDAVAWGVLTFTSTSKR